MKQPIIKVLLFPIIVSIYSCSSPSKPYANKIAAPVSSPAPIVERKCIGDSTEISYEIWTKRPTGYIPTDENRFFSENAKQTGVFALASGVQYRVLRNGCGAKPLLSNLVKVRYHLTLTNGTVIDSSYERRETPSFVLGSVIPGWSEAVSLMQVGSVWEVYVPSYLAYGSEGSGPVPKNAPLLFTVELIDFK